MQNFTFINLLENKSSCFTTPPTGHHSSYETKPFAFGINNASDISKSTTISRAGSYPKCPWEPRSFLITLQEKHYNGNCNFLHEVFQIWLKYFWSQPKADNNTVPVLFRAQFKLKWLPLGNKMMKSYSAGLQKLRNPFHTVSSAVFHATFKWLT